MVAFRDCVERAGRCEIEVGAEEDGGHGVEGGGELRDGGRVGLRDVEEAVPLWSDCAEVGVKVPALHAGEVCGGYGGEGGVCLGWGVALVGVVEHVGYGWGGGERGRAGGGETYR